MGRRNIFLSSSIVNTSVSFAKSLKASQKIIFHRDINISENATYASYQVAHLIAKYDKPFSDGEFIKECLIKAE